MLAATASEMRLWVEPESSNARKVVLEMDLHRLASATLAMAWREMCGSMFASLLLTGGSSSAALSNKRRRWQTLLCPRSIFSLQF